MNRSVRPALLHLLLLIGAVVTLTPFVWMIGASLMPAGEANSLPPRILPSRLSWANYVALFSRLSLARNLLNSIVVSVVVTLASVLINSMAGYAFAKLKFRGREGIFRVLLSALLIPAQIGMLPLFLLLQWLGLVNTYAAVMVPGLAGVFGIFLVRQYVQSLPDELLDAARVDGAGELRIFWSVVLPIIRPILVTLAVFSFLGAWNDFLWPLVVLSDDSMYTLPVAMAGLAGEHVQDTELVMAGSVLTILPVMLVFLFLQRAYVRGILAGSVKG